MELHVLTDKEINELNHFKLREKDCAHQVILAIMASDFMNEERFKQPLSYRDFYDTFVRDKDMYTYETFWIVSIFDCWILLHQGKNEKIINKRSCGIALGFFDAFYSMSSGPCGKVKRDIDKAFEEQCNIHLNETGRYFEDDPEFAYCMAVSILESVGIHREPKNLNVVIDVSNIPID